MSNIVKIELTQGQFALIDQSDLTLVSKFKWCAHKHWHTKKFYAYSHDPSVWYVKSRTPVVIKMHRIILGITDPFIFVDHKDGNPLNNTRTNLRVCSAQDNNRNLSKVRKDSKFKYRGVHQVNGSKKFGARIGINGKKISLGWYETQEQAAQAYNDAAIKYFGEFASLNKINDTACRI